MYVEVSFCRVLPASPWAWSIRERLPLGWGLASTLGPSLGLGVGGVGVLQWGLRLRGGFGTHCHLSAPSLQGTDQVWDWL